MAPLADVREGRAVVGRFSNGELHASVEATIATQDCTLLGSVAPPDEDLLATLLLAHTLVKEGVRSLAALLPYRGYARHDKRGPGRSLGTEWLGRLLHAAGVQEVVTVDVHSRHVHDLFPIPVRSLATAEDRSQVGTEEDGDDGRGERGVGEVVEVPADPLPAIRSRSAADHAGGTTFPSFRTWFMRLAAVTAASGMTGSPAERSALAVHVLQVFRRKYFSRAR